MIADAAAHDWSEWPAPAKLNLFLHITGRRADGYHTLQTVFRLLDWGDRIRLRLRDDDQVRRICGAEGVPAEADLVVRAARALQASTGSRAGVDIAVDKQIPLGGGFGGGSSDAATVLVALNHLWGLHLSVAELARIGLQLGADVPVFVHGDNAWAEGVGEQLTALSLPPAWFLIVDPGVRVATAELFADSELTRDAAPATIADFAAGKLSGNAFEPLLRRREPAVAAALAALAQVGQACVTGTGAGCFVAFPSASAAQMACDAIPAHWQPRVAGGVVQSPLRECLRAAVADFGGGARHG